MGEIPYGQSPCGLGLFCQAEHVMYSPAPVIDFGQHEHGDVATDCRFDILRRHHAKFMAFVERFYQSFGHVQIAWEIARVRQDHPPVRAHLQRRRQRLIDLDRQGVAHHNASLGCADKPAYPISHPARLRHPSSLVPAADEHIAPFI